MTHSVETSPTAGGPADPYILRGWIWCSVCDRLMVPVLVSSGERHYGCATRKCPRPLVPAEKAECLVWDHFTYLNQLAVDAVAPAGRRAALREFLAKVWVGVDADQLYFDWRD